MANELNYVDYDFDENMTQLINRLQASDAWKDTYRSSTGQMLIELYSYVANLILYYVERRAEESYIETAKNRSSVINLVRLLNYNPKRKVSATGYLTFSIAVAHSKNIYIPKYTECETASGTKYLVSEDSVLLTGQTSVSVPIIQGEKVQIETASDGSINQEYEISSDSVENTNVIVTVDGVTWTLVSSFVYSISSDTHYRIRTELDDTVTVIFGDNVNGKAPSTGSIVTIVYVKSDGLSGNVYSSASVTTLNSTIYDEDGTTQTVTVTNANTILGGDDAEDIEEIRYEAPRVFAAGDRLVTKADYVTLIENYAGVANVNAWGENEETAPDYTQFNKVNLVILMQDWALPSTDFKSTLSTYMYTKSMMTVKYEYVDAVILYLMPTLIVKCTKGVSLPQVQSDIETTLAELFELGTTARLGEHKRHSQFVAAVEAVSGVEYCHVTLDVYKVLTAGYGGYSFGGVLEAVNVTPASARLYSGSTLIATDDGAGGWTAESVSPTVSGTINYTTGVVGVNVSPVPSETVSVRYNQINTGSDEEDIVVTKKQVCNLHTTVFTSIGYIA